MALGRGPLSFLADCLWVSGSLGRGSFPFAFYPLSLLGPAFTRVLALHPCCSGEPSPPWLPPRSTSLAEGVGYMCPIHHVPEPLSGTQWEPRQPVSLPHLQRSSVHLEGPCMAEQGRLSQMACWLQPPSVSCPVSTPPALLSLPGLLGASALCKPERPGWVSASSALCPHGMGAGISSSCSALEGQKQAET